MLLVTFSKIQFIPNSFYNIFRVSFLSTVILVCPVNNRQPFEWSPQGPSVIGSDASGILKAFLQTWTCKDVSFYPWRPYAFNIPRPLLPFEPPWALHHVQPMLRQELNSLLHGLNSESHQGGSVHHTAPCGASLWGKFAPQFVCIKQNM